jgi:hypothetical protein
MKKLLVALFAFASMTSAFAAGYGTAGCGLGSIVLGDKPGFTQVFAATTNGTSGSQTFGITSGTSNCGSGGKSAVMFIEANKASLANDIARGQGETLSSLAKIYGIKDSSAMGSALQKSQATIFASQDATAISTSIESVLKSNKLL